MLRGITFGEYNTAEDWGLTMSTKKIPLPAPKTTLVSVPGRDGDIDMTEALDGVVHYDDRPASFVFEMLEGTPQKRIELVKEISRAIHGKLLKIIDQDDYPGYYLIGRVSVTDISHNKAYSTIKVSATCRPWRYAINKAARTIVLTSLARVVVLNNDGDRVVNPTITVSGYMTMEFGTSSAQLSAGTYVLPSFRLKPGLNTLKLSGSGSAVFTYQEGIF